MKKIFAEYSNKRINDSYETAKGSLLPLGNCIDDAKSLECPSLEAEIQHNSMLQEICFWLARLEFPQPLVTFVLSMLPENDYKVRATRSNLWDLGGGEGILGSTFAGKRL